MAPKFKNGTSGMNRLKTVVGNWKYTKTINMCSRNKLPIIKELYLLNMYGHQGKHFKCSFHFNHNFVKVLIKDENGEVKKVLSNFPKITGSNRPSILNYNFKTMISLLRNSLFLICTIKFICKK